MSTSGCKIPKLPLAYYILINAGNPSNLIHQPTPSPSPPIADTTNLGSLLLTQTQIATPPPPETTIPDLPLLPAPPSVRVYRCRATNPPPPISDSTTLDPNPSLFIPSPSLPLPEQPPHTVACLATPPAFDASLPDPTEPPPLVAPSEAQPAAATHQNQTRSRSGILKPRNLTNGTVRYISGSSCSTLCYQ